MNNKRFDWFRVLHNKDLTSLIDKLIHHVLFLNDTNAVCCGELFFSFG